MKYTSLFSAVAIAAAMGTTALGTVTTNAVGTVQDFEGADPIASRAGWTVQTEDQSEIIAAPLSSQDAVEGYTANQHLKLNTEGNELVYAPGTVSQPKAIIEMKVRLVASDTAPAISAEDTTVHAAVYLQVSEPVDASNDGLYAYTASGWSKLDAPFNAQLATGSMVALRVLMDYTARKATYEGCVLADAENDIPVYVSLGTKDMANADDAQSQGHLNTIAFKGTGGVDDLFVNQITETASTANITLQMISGGEWQAIEEGTVDTVNPAQSYSYLVTIPSGKVPVVTVCDDEGTTLATLDNVIDQYGQLEVSCEDYAFVADEDYLIRVAFTDPSSLPASFSIGDADTQAALATAGVDPVAMDGNYFIVNVIEPDGATASLLGASTLGGEFTAVSATRTVKNGYTELKYEIPANETAKFFKVKFTK